MNRKDRRAGAKHGVQVDQIFAVALQHHQAGRLADAEKIYTEILRVDPNNVSCLNNLSLLASRLGRVDEAVALLKRACALAGATAEAHMNLGNLLQAQGQIGEAVACYEKSLRIRPNSASVQLNLGNALRAQGRVEPAIACYQEALRIDPNLAEALLEMGNTLNWQRKAAEAVTYFERAVAARPDFAAAYNNLGSTLLDLDRHDEAAACFERAIRLNPSHPDAYVNLGNMLTDSGRLAEAAANYEKVLAIDPDHSGALSNLVFALNYTDTLDPPSLAGQHFRAGERIEGKFRVAPPPHRNAIEPGRKLKIGYVSPDFRMHAVAFFFEPLIRARDRAAIEAFCYSDAFAPDAMTERLSALADHWLSTTGMNDDDLAARIREDGIDILVDLAGHSAHNRLPVFARRPAPVQMTWLGYPNTTGLKSIDYRLVDAVTDPIGAADALATETLVRLDGGFLCYAPLVRASEPVPPPCLQAGRVTFGSFNNLSKVSAATFATWGRLLERLPTARLLLKSRVFAVTGIRESILARLAAHGVTAERVTLRPAIPDLAGHLASYHEMDIALDSFPYNGTTTTCEALWMGVPVVTLAGDRHLGRVGASLLTQVGLTELIARDQDTYVDLAASLADDLPRLMAYHAELRPRMAASSLCDAPAFARKVEAVYRDVWQRWCARS